MQRRSFVEAHKEKVDDAGAVLFQKCSSFFLIYFVPFHWPVSVSIYLSCKLFTMFPDSSLEIGRRWSEVPESSCSLMIDCRFVSSRSLLVSLLLSNLLNWQHHQSELWSCQRVLFLDAGVIRTMLLHWNQHRPISGAGYSECMKLVTGKRLSWCSRFSVTFEWVTEEERMKRSAEVENNREDGSQTRM